MLGHDIPPIVISPPCPSFNSLYEMPERIERALRWLDYATFNSLFEMQWGRLSYVQRELELSILYLRCWS